MSIDPGWYKDPDGKPCERYWDGKTWSEDTRPLIEKLSPEINSQAKGRSPGCFGWGVILIVVVAVISFLTPDTDEGEAPTNNQTGSEINNELTSGIQSWADENNIASYFEKLVDLSLRISDSAEAFDFEAIADSLDEMSQVGQDLLSIPSYPDEQFNNYWRSIYIDLISLGEFSEPIRNLDPVALEESLVVLERITTNSQALTDYVNSN